MHWLIEALASPAPLSEGNAALLHNPRSAVPFFLNPRPKGATATLGLQGRQT